MAKTSFGEYGAYETPGGIRFQKNNRLTSEKNIPKEVAELLRSRLSGKRSRVESPKEEKLKESKEPKEVTLSDIVKGTPEGNKAIEKAVEDSIKDQEEITKLAQKLDSEDFDEEPINSISESTPESVANPQNTINPEFLESVSIHSASLKDMAQALYERFGIYTVYLGTLPRQDEVNPLTSIPFTKYHLGVAYQAAIYAQNQGLLERDFESYKTQIDTSRDYEKTHEMDEPNYTLGEARKANDFNFRTSVEGTKERPSTKIEHIVENGVVKAVQVPVSEGENVNGTTSRFDEKEDELIVEPPITGKKIIRPDW